MEDYLNFMKIDDLIYLGEGRLIFFKLKTSFFLQMEDDLNILVNGRKPPKLKNKINATLNLNRL